MEPTSLTIEVTQDLIDDGCHESNNCPVARAVMKSFAEWAGIPDLSVGSVYRDNLLYAYIGITVMERMLSVYTYYYGQALPPVGFEFEHNQVIGDWVCNYDRADTMEGVTVEPITFEIPITDDMRKLREVVQEIYRTSALAPTD